MVAKGSAKRPVVRGETVYFKPEPALRHHHPWLPLSCSGPLNHEQLGDSARQNDGTVY